MSQATVEKKTRSVATSAAAQQSDNIAHALAGAGGGIISMVLTYVAYWLLHAGFPPPQNMWKLIIMAGYD